MFKIKFISSVLISVISVCSINAQERMIQGFVTTFDSIPLIGASITVKSTKQEVLSDSNGNFSVPCNSEDVLEVRARGFNTQKVKLDSKIKFAAVNLKIKPGEKNKEYVIGYGSVADRDKLNALVSVSNDEIDFSNYENISEIIKGRFPGVVIENGNVIIRGISSLQGTSAALIILDGMEVDNSILRNFPTSQIKSINIIKDASAAIYGSRGAPGVVIIESKSSDM